MEDTAIAVPAADPVQAEINEIRTGAAYNDSGHPQHTDTVAGMSALYEAKLSGGPTGEPEAADIEDADTGISTTPEFRQTIADAMAAPETPDGYNFEDTKLKFGDDANWEAALENQMRPLFHAAGLSDTEANGLLNTFIEVQRSTPEQHAKMAVNTRIALELRWGDDYKANLTTAANAAMKLGGKNLISFLDNTGAGDHWSVVETLHRAGKRMGV